MADRDYLAIESDLIMLSFKAMALTSAAKSKCEAIADSLTSDPLRAADEARLFVEMAESAIRGMGDAFNEAIDIIKDASRATVSA